MSSKNFGAGEGNRTLAFWMATKYATIITTPANPTIL